jgi:hypothetical protein
MKRLLLSFVTVFLLIPCAAQQSERPESGCAGNPIPVFILSEPASQSICPGKSVSFTAHAINVQRKTWEMSTDSGTTWYSSIGQLTSSNNGSQYYDTLTIPVVYQEMSGYMFRCSYSSVCGNGSYRTSIAVLTVAGNPVQIISQPSNVVACVGNSVDFSIDIAGGSLSYQWQQSNDGGNSFLNMTEKNTANLHFESLTTDLNNYQYRCVVNSECGGTITSNAALLTVNNISAVITSQPQDVLICETDTAYFSVAVSGSNLQYQWQRRLASGSIYSDIPSADVNVLTIPYLDEPGYYRCKISSNCPTVFSNTVYGYYTLTEFSPDAVKFFCEGDMVYINGISINNVETYQWMESRDSGITYSNIPDETSFLLAVISSTSNNGYRYKCYVSSPCFTGYSNITTLYSTPLPLSVISQSQNVTACVGKFGRLYVANTGTTERYQWQISNDSGITYFNINIGDGIHYQNGGGDPYLDVYRNTPGNFIYRCKIIGRCAPDIYSSPVTLSVVSSPYVPSDTSLYVSCDTCTMNIMTAFDTTGFTNYEFIAGEAYKDGFTIGNPAAAGLGWYRLNLFNTIGCQNYSYIKIGIKEMDTIKICSSSSLTLTSSLSGSSYQWQINRGFGNGFEDVAENTTSFQHGYVTGALSNTLHIPEIRGPLLIRCKINGISYSNTFLINLTNFWTGAASTSWEDTRNWTCGVPQYNSDVYIRSNTTRMPQINSNNLTCRSLTIENGASVKIKSGMNLYVNDYFH